MAGRGPAPKAQHARERDTKRRISDKAAILVDDGELRGPELQELTGRAEWPEAVLRWFTGWRTSPQAAVFLGTDWTRLGMLAYLVEEYLLEAKGPLLAEIRLNEERLGATVADRQRLRFVVETAPQLAPVTELPARESLADRLRGEE